MSKAFLRDDCVNDCLRIAQTVALECAPPPPLLALYSYHFREAFTAFMRIQKIRLLIGFWLRAGLLRFRIYEGERRVAHRDFIASRTAIA